MTATKEELVEAILVAIREREIDIARGIGGYHYVRAYRDGTVYGGVAPSYEVPMSEWEGKPDAPRTVWAQTCIGEGASRDVWEWYEIEHATDEYSEDCEIVDAAVEAAGGWMEFIRCGREIEHNGRTLCVFEYEGNLFFHDYTPHDWDEPTFDEAGLDEWLAGTD